MWLINFHPNPITHLGHTSFAILSPNFHPNLNESIPFPSQESDQKAFDFLFIFIAAISWFYHSFILGVCLFTRPPLLLLIFQHSLLYPDASSMQNKPI